VQVLHLNDWKMMYILGVVPTFIAYTLDDGFTSIDLTAFSKDFGVDSSNIVQFDFNGRLPMLGSQSEKLSSAILSWLETIE
jgi:hypothetical protein